MNKQIRIMFTSVGRRVELMQMFKASAENLNIDLMLYGADVASDAPALSICDRTVIVPKINDEHYIPELVRVCSEEKIDAVVPTIDTDLLMLATEIQRFEEVGTRVVVSNPEKISICRDKRYTADYFKSVGLKSPHTVCDIALYNEGFPAFIKPKDGSASIDAHRIENEEELVSYSKKVAGYIVQPCVDGTEYTVDAFCNFDGEPIYITPRIRLAVRAGEVLKTEICQDRQIIDEMKQLIRDFKPCGPITVQLIREKSTGIDWFIEINPRFGGGTPLSMRAGANSAEAMLKLLMGENLGYIDRAAVNKAVYSRFDQCVCIEPGEVRADDIEAVIFDLDDTLYSELEYVRSGFNKVAAVLPQVENAADKLWQVFLQGKPAIDEVLSHEGIADKEVKAKCLEAYRNQMPDIHLREGAAELLQTLRNNGKKLGIITDGRPEGQRNKIAVLGLKNLVEEIIITDELGGVQFRKPNDIAFRMMKYRLNVPYDKMVYIGDNCKKDFYAPKALGMKYVYFRNEKSVHGSENISTAVTVNNFDELRKVLL